jgi:hypothetical protein
MVVGALLFLCALGVQAQELPEPGPEAPRLRWGEEVWCITVDQNKTVRFQCVDEPGEEPYCLLAPGWDVLGERLDRTQYCAREYDSGALAELAANYRLVDAIAEAPPGWERDEEGVVVQTSFDMLARFYLGAAWLASFDFAEAAQSLERTRFEMGLIVSSYDPWEDDRHDFRALEGAVSLNELEIDALLLAYDYNHRASEPSLRIVTFFDRPRRTDIYADFGIGLSVLRLRSRLGWEERLNDLEFGELHGAWNMLQSEDMYNLLRLELGVGGGGQWHGDDEMRLYVSPQAHLKMRAALDGRGMHHLLAQAGWDGRWMVEGDEEGELKHLASAKLSYEWIMLSINNQPLSLYLEAATEYWQGEAAAPWRTSIASGLRFSLWAPAKLSPKELE